jgi:hypothetical protein
MKKPLFMLGALGALLLALAAYAGGKPSTAPGKYKEWGPDIDEIEILKTFKTADYDRIVVRHFDTSKVELPDPKAKWYGTLKMALSSYDDAFIEAFQKELKAKARIEEAAQAPTSRKTLIIRGTVLELDPGSRAGRYFGGFGAGAASSKLSGEIVDAATGDVLVRFTQARRSGGTWKPAGGSDLEVMRDAIHATAKDVAHLLDAF